MWRGDLLLIDPKIYRNQLMFSSQGKMSEYKSAPIRILSFVVAYCHSFSPPRALLRHLDRSGEISGRCCERWIAILSLVVAYCHRPERDI